MSNKIFFKWLVVFYYQALNNNFNWVVEQKQMIAFSQNKHKALLQLIICVISLRWKNFWLEWNARRKALSTISFLLAFHSLFCYEIDTFQRFCYKAHPYFVSSSFTWTTIHGGLALKMFFFHATTTVWVRWLCSFHLLSHTLYTYNPAFLSRDNNASINQLAKFTVVVSLDWVLNSYLWTKAGRKPTSKRLRGHLQNASYTTIIIVISFILH